MTDQLLPGPIKRQGVFCSFKQKMSFTVISPLYISLNSGQVTASSLQWTCVTQPGRSLRGSERDESRRIVTERGDQVRARVWRWAPTETQALTLLQSRTWPIINISRKLYGTIETSSKYKRNQRNCQAWVPPLKTLFKTWLTLYYIIFIMFWLQV